MFASDWQVKGCATPSGLRTAETDTQGALPAVATLGYSLQPLRGTESFSGHRRFAQRAQISDVSSTGD